MMEIDIAVIGAGFGGLGAAIRLQGAGFTDFLVFDRGDDVGGTWRDNTYPGCACDVPSHLYSFSFAPNPSWSATFSGQREIWDYLRGCVDRFGVRPKLRLRHELRRADWDSRRGRWRLDTSGGEYHARVLICATGPLSEPVRPDIPGLDEFTGTVFHSARWRHDHDLTGRRVAVVGTGASAVQFVPHIQPVVARLTLFQRTPAWVMSRRSQRITPQRQALFRRFPATQRAARAGVYLAREAMAVGFLHPRVNRVAAGLSLRKLRREVPDPRLRAALTPGYTMGCKRVLISDDYWPSLTRSNVEVVSAGISRVTADGLVTTDGGQHPADTVILGTGFHVTDPPVLSRIHGRDGRSLAAAWTPSMRAYQGTTVAGFPNLFFLLGPNTGLGHTSVVLMIEAQLRLIIAALRHLRATGVTAIEPTVEAQRRWTERVDRRMRGTVWQTGCASWYLDATGRNSTIWPGYATGYRWRLRRFRPADHQAVEIDGTDRNLERSDAV
ncbi:4-hydroxyacetophenone monooxygenase [Micromonospora endophytica]|uniref:4-hydroxyacetophenone monooxygenase n=2 Tax=Micromonospora endophytica TaxID=515350 RepID=A0A2W2CJ69_9ACTN|nr:4-hydroxyacetophenone monooxygenase [Micromonospora endophytica]RIW43524.1 NAD(P)/FAD-dependent oxidoreductase [Micromonospora endophytica]